MSTPTSAVKVNPNTGALIDPVAATFKSANNIINGDRYLTSSTTSLSLGNGTKTLTIGTGLSYSTQQDIIIANDATHHMHATVTSYNSSTGELVADVAQHTGSGTFTSWTVNVGGIAAGVIPTGGTTGQVLNKASGSNYDVQWGPTFTGSGSLDIGTSIVEIQQQLQTIGTFYAGGNIYISDALTTAGDVVFSGAYNATFTLTGNTSVTFPTSGTLLSTAAIGVSVQAYDADLTTWAGITPGANVGAALAIAAGNSGGIKLAKPWAAARKDATQSFSSGTNQTLAFTTAVGGDALTSSSTIFTATLAGVVLVTFSCRVYSSVAAGDPYSVTMLLSVQGSGTSVDAYSANAAAIVDPNLLVNALVSFAIPVAVTANQTLKIVMNVDTAGADTIVVSNAFVSYSYLNQS